MRTTKIRSHAVRLKLDVTTGEYTPKCTCGWEGKPSKDRFIANYRGFVHRKGGDA